MYGGGIPSALLCTVLALNCYFSAVTLAADVKEADGQPLVQPPGEDRGGGNVMGGLTGDLGQMSIHSVKLELENEGAEGCSGTNTSVPVDGSSFDGSSSADRTLQGPVDQQEDDLQGLMNELTRGLLPKVTMSMLHVLGGLPCEGVKKLHNALCLNHGRCDVDGAAFVLSQFDKFAPVDADDCSDFNVVAFVQNPKRYIWNRLERVDGLHLDRGRFEHLDGASFLRSLGQWYKSVDYTADSDDTFKNAFAYFILADENPDIAARRLKILLRFVGRQESKTLFDYWMGQPDERLWTVYLYISGGGVYGDLLVLQPNVFNMDCIQTGDCTEWDFKGAFEGYTKFVAFPDGLKFFPKYCSDLIFSKVAEVLRRMTERMTVEDLGPDEKNMLQYSAEERELPAEPAFQVMIHSPNTRPGHVILDAKMETWMALDHQMWVLMGPGCVGSIEEFMHFFPPTRVTKYLKKRGVTFLQSVEQYEETVVGILWERLQVVDVMWLRIEPGLRESLEVGTFWRLLAFLEDHSQYDGLFHRIFWWDDKKWKDWSNKLESAGLGALIQEITNGPVTENHHRKLGSLAVYAMAVELEEYGKRFKGRFEPLYEQCRNGLLEDFEGSSSVSCSLEEYVLSIPTKAGELSGLRDLQVALLNQEMHGMCWRFGVGLETLEDMVKGYSSGQFGNIYQSDSEILFLFWSSWLRDFDPDMSGLNRPVKRAEFFALLSKICQQAHLGRDSFFGLILDDLGQRSELLRPFPTVCGAIFWTLRNSSRDQNLLENSGASWIELERAAYADCSERERLALVVELAPKLATVISTAGYMIDTKRYQTFDELVSYIEILWEAQQSHAPSSLMMWKAHPQ